MPSPSSRKEPLSHSGSFSRYHAEQFTLPRTINYTTAKMVNQIHGDSNVGKPSLYESGDQENLPRDQRQHGSDVSKGLETDSKHS